MNAICLSKTYGKRKVYLCDILYVCFGIPKKTLPVSHEQTQIFETCVPFQCTKLKRMIFNL